MPAQTLLLFRCLVASLLHYFFLRRPGGAERGAGLGAALRKSIQARRCLSFCSWLLLQRRGPGHPQGYWPAFLGGGLARTASPKFFTSLLRCSLFHLAYGRLLPLRCAVAVATGAGSSASSPLEPAPMPP